MARKGRSPKGLRKAGRQPNEQVTPQRVEHTSPKKHTVRLGDMEFEQVSDNMLASDQGMSPEELKAFVNRLASGKDMPIPDDMTNEQFDQIATAARKLLPRKEPHLIDLILDGGLFNPDAAPPLGVLHQAKKFIFDASASEYIGSLLMKAQAEVLSQHDWARPPFETTWIEFDHAVYWERGLGMANDYMKGTPDNLFGMLIHHGTVWLFSYAPSHSHDHRGETLGCGPFQYQLHVPISFEEELAMARRFDMGLNTYRQALLGGMINPETGKPTLSVDWWNAMAGEIVRSHKMFINPTIKGGMDKVRPEQRASILASGAGDLKLILTLLLMVTRPRKMFNVTETGPKRMLYKGHNLVRRAHSVVTMQLAKEAALHHAVHHEFTSQHRQMHDVRGHWAETRHNAICQEHSWEPLDKDHFYCLNCPAKRWWRKAHTRGELRLGDKTTDYHVKR
jgi:hypothetical protein